MGVIDSSIEFYLLQHSRYITLYALDFLGFRKIIFLSTTVTLTEGIFLKDSSFYCPFTRNLKEQNDHWDLCILTRLAERGSIAHQSKRGKGTIWVRVTGYRHTHRWYTTIAYFPFKQTNTQTNKHTNKRKQKGKLTQ